MTNLPAGKLWNESISKSYEEYAKNPNSIYQQTNSVLVNLIPSEDYEFVMDVGCGNGHTTAHLLRKFCPRRLIAVDVSKDQLKKYEDRFAEVRGIEFEYRNNLFLEISQISDTLDLIVSNASINHVGNLEDVFDKANILLRSGGVFAFSVFDHVSVSAQNSFYPILSNRLREYATREGLKFEDVFQPKISPEQLSRLAKKHSFSLENQKSISFKEDPSLMRFALRHYADRLLWGFFPELPEEEAKKIILEEGDNLLNERYNQRQISFYILRK
jgi:trans-aconitate methyltransferase